MIVTVIVPTYNRASLLQLALESIPRTAADHDVEVLVVDDGSTDATAKVVKHFAECGRLVRYIRQDNAGIASARNAGLENLDAETGYVTFLDSDDILPSGALAAQVAELTAEPNLDLVYGRMVMADDIDPHTLQPTNSSRQLNMVGIQLSCALFRRSLIERIGDFDTDFVQAEDTDYLLRVFESGAKFRQTETVCLFYRRHSDNLTKNLAESRRFFARAIQKSMLRRRRDPSLKLAKPEFEVQQVGLVDFY